MNEAEEILEKFRRLEQIPHKAYNVRGNPAAIQTVVIEKETLVVRWHKRIQKYKINLLKQYAQQVSREKAIEFLKSQDIEYMRKFSDRTFNYMFDEWIKNQQ